MTSRRDFIKHALAGTISYGLMGATTSVADTKAENAMSDVEFKLRAQLKRGTESYTQGLSYFWDDKNKKAFLYESGGRYGKSLLRRVDAETLEVIQQIKVPREYFAEGIAIVDDRLYMLTWQEHACLVYDRETLRQVDEFRYRGEGWGLAYDGETLAMSDGSSKIRFVNPNNFRQKRSIDVHFTTKNGLRRSVAYLNELEYVGGELWANVFQQKYLVRINSETGEVIGSALNFANLVPKALENSGDYVLNGLAFDSAGRRLFLTGKCWPIVYVLDVISKRRNVAEAPNL